MNRVVEKLKHRFPSGSFTRNALILAGGTAMGQIIYLIGMPVTSRLFSAADFGNLAFYQSVVSFLVLVAALRYEMAALLPEEDETAANLLVLALLAVCGMGALVTVGLWLLPKSWIFGSRLDALQRYWWLLPVGMFGGAVNMVLTHWATRRRNFPAIARTKITQVFGQIFVQVVLGVMRLGAFGLMVGDILGRSGGATALARLLWREDSRLFRQVSWAQMSKAAVRYRLFPLLSSGAILLNTGSMHIMTFLLAFTYGTQVLGWYALVMRVASAPFQLVSKGVLQVYMGEAAVLARENPAGLRRLFFRSMRRLFLMGLIPIGIIVLGGPFLFSLAFGPDWHQAGIYARLLTGIFLTDFAILPLQSTLNILERQSWQLTWDASRLFLFVTGFWAVSQARGSAEQALLVYGIIGTAMSLLYVLLCSLAMQKLIRQHDRRRASGSDEGGYLPANEVA